MLPNIAQGTSKVEQICFICDLMTFAVTEKGKAKNEKRDEKSIIYCDYNRCCMPRAFVGDYSRHYMAYMPLFFVEIQPFNGYGNMAD